MRHCLKSSTTILHIGAYFGIEPQTLYESSIQTNLWNIAFIATHFFTITALFNLTTARSSKSLK